MEICIHFQSFFYEKKKQLNTYFNIKISNIFKSKEFNDKFKSVNNEFD